MALDKQIHLYSLETGHFYSNHEKYLHEKIQACRQECNQLKKLLPECETQLLEAGCSTSELADIRNGRKILPAGLQGFGQTAARYDQLWRLIRHKQRKAKESKERLLRLLSNKAAQNRITMGRNHIRSIREASLHDNNVVSVFESSLTRSIGVCQDQLTEDIMVVQVYYLDIFQDLVYHGFRYKGETYRYFTSSAGQIRKKKAVFIREAVWLRLEKTIYCGLTLDRINAVGGNNVNKHLAYMALTNSATDEWEEFDIEKSIVIDDFETNVRGVFDFIDDNSYAITRKSAEVPITHTDGAGMVLPSLMDRNAMFRAPWIKGLLGVFDFHRFIREHHCSPIITDIYGKEHDILQEDIQIIFTKSQFKMWRYYSSWDEYKHSFKACGCTVGRCNIEEERCKNARLNYQMLQTLTDITDNEIQLLTRKSAQKIEQICSCADTIKEILGITPYNTDPTPLQKAIKQYPALLNDPFVKDMIREIKDSLVKKYRSGKLEINGKYTYLLPDFYAACEYWFGHIEQPRGLLADGEVYCRLFRSYEKVDCLRSPHLYREHAVRRNMACSACGRNQPEALQKWFITDGIYTSARDSISKLLQFDVDGDKALVVADPLFIEIAERNMKDIVPLYYYMRKAQPQLLTSEAIYNGLHAAFTGAPIGADSNQISKIWNSDVFISGTEEERKEAMQCVKWLCMENNFHIDYAKTLYKPERPPKVGVLINKYTRCKLPAFFEFAKNKDQSQLMVRNGSFVNKIFNYIPDKPIRIKGLIPDNIDYRKLMSHPETKRTCEISSLYDTLSRRYCHMLRRRDGHVENYAYAASVLREHFAKTGCPEHAIADMLVEYIYGHKKRNKQLLWLCYGQIIAENLAKNISLPETRAISCRDCGDWFEIAKRDSKTCRCSLCQQEYRKAYQREYMRKRKFSTASGA